MTNTKGCHETPHSIPGWGQIRKHRPLRCSSNRLPVAVLMSSGSRPPITLTREERERCAQVVATADRINAERPTLSWRMSQTPPPSDGAPDRRPIAWPLASLVAMAIVVLMAFYVAGAR